MALVHPRRSKITFSINAPVDWDTVGPAYGDRILASLERLLPDLRRHIVVRRELTPSQKVKMKREGDAYDNAMCESFFATLECELLDRERFRTQADARLALFDFIEGWYNPRRRHSALDYLSPMIYERSHGTRDRTVPSGATIDQGGAISLSPSGMVP